MILRAEDGSKAQVILSDDDQSFIYAEHSPALKLRSDGFFVYRKD